MTIALELRYPLSTWSEGDILKMYVLFCRILAQRCQIINANLFKNKDLLFRIPFKIVSSTYTAYFQSRCNIAIILLYFPSESHHLVQILRVCVLELENIIE